MHTEGVVHTRTVAKIRGQLLQHTTEICAEREREGGGRRIKNETDQIRKITCCVVCENEIENPISDEFCLITRGSLMIESL